MRIPRLTEDEIQAHLAKIPEWDRQGDTIRRTYRFQEFAEAMEFVTLVAETAEAVNHHPDIDIRYSHVTLLLTTHDSGGLTENDVELAAACDDLADGVGH